MAKGKFVSYIRVSTTRQGASGLGLEAQREAVTQFARSHGGTLVAEVKEIESGKNNDRPQIAEALSLCRLHRATLVIAKLDRLARNVHFISALMESGVEFTAVDFPTANRLTVHILAAVAEHEAAMISQRTTAALTAAKARGAKLGGQRGSITRMAEMAKKGNIASAIARSEKTKERNADILPQIVAIQASGRTSTQAIAEALNARGFEAPRGGRWSATQVWRVLKAA